MLCCPDQCCIKMNEDIFKNLRTGGLCRLILPLSYINIHLQCKCSVTAHWYRQVVNPWIQEAAVVVLFLFSWATLAQCKTQKHTGLFHTSALFCFVSTGSCGCVLVCVSSMLTSFNLRQDTSSIRSSFWVSREVLLISSWGKHTHSDCELFTRKTKLEQLLQSTV